MTFLPNLRSIVILLLFLIHLETEAQEEIKLDNQIWTDLWLHGRLTDPLEIYGDASYRYSQKGKQLVYVIRPAVKYQLLPSLSIHGGFGFFYNDLKDLENVLELRPWQGIRLGWPDIGPLKFKHYLRLEQRVFTAKDVPNELVHRGRYRVSAKIPINGKIVQDDVFYVPVAFEWLGTADEGLRTVWSSQTRMTFGAGYAFNRKWLLEFEYMRWWSKDLPGQEFQASDNIFRLKIHRNGWILGE